MSERVIPRCPFCYRQVADWLLCNDCTDKVSTWIERIADLYEDLQDTLTGQVSMGDGGKMNERPLPYKEKASKAATYVKNQVVALVRDLEMGDTQWNVDQCTCRPFAACRGYRVEHLADTVDAMTAWLGERIERIRSSVSADEIAGEMEYCVKIMLPFVDRPADLLFCGRCVVCGKDLYAKPGQVEGVCGHCRAAGIETLFNPVAGRELVLARLEHHWGTATDCTRILLNYGLEVTLQTIRDWANKPDKYGAVKLPRRGQDSLGHALYRFGDVMNLAQQHKAWVEEKRARKRSVA